MITLALDASTYVGDVAVLADGRVLAERSVAMRDPRHELLMPAVAETLSAAGVKTSEIDRVVCGAGPGSFTSLRIAGAIAKGIAMATVKPLHAVSSLGLVAAGVDLSPGLYLVAVDALRGEFYVGLFDVGDASDGGDAVVERHRARLVSVDDVDTVAAKYEARVITPSQRPGAVHAVPRARGVLRLESALTASGPVDLAAWEPAYGRLAEAQVRWERTHGRPLAAG